MAIKTLKRSHANLSQQIAAILREEILSDPRPGQRLASIEQLAKRFEVSFITVREGLTALAEEGLIERRVGSGTYVGDLTKGRHVGVLVEWDISDPRTSYFYRRTPQRVVRFLRANGWPARLYAGHLAPDEESLRPPTCTDFLEAVERRRLGGVVAFTPDQTFPQWYGVLEKQRVPVVGPDEKCTRRVTWDSTALVRTGVDYLLSHGRRRLALMEYHWREGRPRFVEHFQAALTGAGVAANERWIRRAPTPCAPQAGWEEFRAIWAEGREKPDGLLICNDNLFPGAVMAILQLGIRVPEDLLVVTHFNHGSGMVCPFPVVKLEFDPDGYARTAGATLLKLMRHEPVPEAPVLLPHELVEPEDSSRSLRRLDRAAESANEIRMTDMGVVEV